MKALLGSLMCLLLGAAQCLALSGGPPYPIGTNIVGTYAGVLQPPFCPLPNPANCPGLNSIGVFSLGVPQSGLGSGIFVMFSRGRVFSGTIQGYGDPIRATLQGVLAASYNYTLSVAVPGENGAVTIEQIPVTTTANGPIQADILSVRSSSISSAATLRVDGEATLFISQGAVNDDGSPAITQEITFNVTGVKQSDTVAGTGIAGG